MRNALLSLFLENINSFNLETSLIKVMNVYNKSIHKTAKHSPYEVFYSKNETLYKEIHDKILANYKKYN